MVRISFEMGTNRNAESKVDSYVSKIIGGFEAAGVNTFSTFTKYVRIKRSAVNVVLRHFLCLYIIETYQVPIGSISSILKSRPHRSKSFYQTAPTPSH